MLVVAAAAPASARLVYQRIDSTEGAGSHVIVAARDDGTRARVVTHGFAPVISPTGRRIAFFVLRHSGRVDLYVIRVDGTHRRLLVRNVFAVDRPIAWSSDGRYLVVADAGHVFGAYLVDVQAPKVRQIPTESDFSDATFAPDARHFIVAEIGSTTDSLLALKVGSRKQRHVGQGNFPVWGRSGIALNRHHKVLLRKRVDDPGHMIFRENGVVPLPVAWSADGKVLLIAEAKGSTTTPLLLHPSKGTAKDVPVSGLTIRTLSRDGRQILGEKNQDVVSVRADGTVRVLAAHATNPSWNH
jgi:hypothetical protein